MNKLIIAVLSFFFVSFFKLCAEFFVFPNITFDKTVFTFIFGFVVNYEIVITMGIIFSEDDVISEFIDFVMFFRGGR